MRIAETEVIDRFMAMGAQYAPLSIVSVKTEARLTTELCADALMQFAIEGGAPFQVLAEVTSLGTPKSIRATCMQVLDLVGKARNPELVPLVIAPYISPSQADVLREAGVSWIDLSGNMVLRTRNGIYIERTGQPNQFPDSTPIKKVFQGTASLVARALLLKPGGFASLSEIRDFIRLHSGSITIPTVSKVLRSLEEDLLVSRAGSCISASNPAQLLSRLAESHVFVARNRQTSISRFAAASAEQVFQDFCSQLGPTYVCCGFYAAELKGLAVSSDITLYVRDMRMVRQASERLGPDLLPDDEFGQVKVIETKDRTPWFNAQTVRGLSVVDDLELYLEMTIDTPRGPKIAEVLRRRLLPDP